MTAPERLYGVPGAELCWPDLGSVYELQIEPDLVEKVPSPRVIEEWSVWPAVALLPSARDLLDRLIEDAAENAGTGDYYDSVEHLAREPELLALAQGLVDAFAGRITYSVADKRLAEHTVTWDDEGEPLIDGELLYRRREAAP